MKSRTSQLLAVLVGSIALSSSLSTALPAFSQASNSATPAQNGRMHRNNYFNLTADQQAQMKQIRQNERNQIDAVLTADQKAQLESERQNRPQRQPGANGQRAQNGENRGQRHSPFDSLNLSAEQRTQIQEIHKTAREQMDAVLTPEQRQLRDQHRQQRQQNRQQNRQNNQNS